ncbi:MAG: hypothetical protein K2J67_00035 [Lachnospiraceae bacterium]|nr:hypothetical protein [Lachnospiraceae bacterium]
MSTTINYSYDYYLRNAYSSNRFARKSENRPTMQNKDLIQADSDAVRKITEKLRDLEYSSDNASEILTNVKMFVETYNNLVESTGSSDSDSIYKLKSKITQLSKNNKDELESLGFTLSASGKISLDKSKFGECSPSKIERFFGKDSEFMDTVRNYSIQAKRSARRLVDVQDEEWNQKKKPSISNPATPETELLESLLANPESNGTFDAKG